MVAGGEEWEESRVKLPKSKRCLENGGRGGGGGRDRHKKGKKNYLHLVTRHSPGEGNLRIDRDKGGHSICKTHLQLERGLGGLEGTKGEKESRRENEGTKIAFHPSE